MSKPTRLFFGLATLIWCTSCATSPQAQDPFDVALGMAALGIMQDQTPSDATMQSFARAVAPPVVQQTIVQEAPKTQQGGGQ